VAFDSGRWLARPESARWILERERRRHAANSELPFALPALGQTNAAARAAAQVRPRDCRGRRLFDGDPRFDAVRRDAAFGGVFAGPCVAGI